ncbi:MAG: C45 family peptidase [Salinivirgaceae bacterium]|nr:C45 family peptidase [Salinivirgaceae bacterium]
MKTIKNFFIYLTISAFLAVVVQFFLLLNMHEFDAPTNMPPMDTTQVVRVDSALFVGSSRLCHSTSGLWEMRAVGEPFERGVAIGKLLEPLLYYQENVFVNQLTEFVPSKTYFNFLKHFIFYFNRNLDKYVDDEFKQEIYGQSLSCSHDFDFSGSSYFRQMNYHSAHDIGHTMQDYMLVGCSSFAAWDSITTNGSLLVGRNMDFYIGEDFAKNKLVSFFFPTDGYKFASIGWPGMVGVLSGMNECGLTATINSARAEMPTSSATPISLVIRKILQYASNIDEAIAIADSSKIFVSEAILIASARDHRAVVIEKTPTRQALFTTQTPYIISTNHYQSAEFASETSNIDNVATSDSPHRWKRINELIDSLQPIDYQKCISILRDYRGVGGTNIGIGNEMALNQFLGHHSVVFAPDSLMMWVSTSPWQCGEYVAYNLATIFANPNSDCQTFATTSLNVAADTSATNDLQHLYNYRHYERLVKNYIKNKLPLSINQIDSFVQANPMYYRTHELMGDYYAANNNNQQAITSWQKALSLAIPKEEQRNHIAKKLKKAERKHSK